MILSVSMFCIGIGAAMAVSVVNGVMVAFRPVGFSPLNHIDRDTNAKPDVRSGHWHPGGATRLAIRRPQHYVRNEAVT
jgi:hypothetical protein